MMLSNKWYEFAYDDIDSAKIILREDKTIMFVSFHIKR